MTIKLALFPKARAAGPAYLEAVEMSRQDFVHKMTTHHRVVRKDQTSLFSPTEYLPGRKVRSKYGVAAVTLFVFDIESKEAPLTLVDVESLAHRIQARGWTYILSSTHSHKDEDCRLRLVLFPDEPILPTEFKEARRRVRVALRLDGMTDPAAEDLPRIFYWPSCPPDREPLVDYFEGKDVCMEELLDGYIAAPFEHFDKAVPEGWEYVRPAPPVITDLAPLHAVMDAYKGGGTEDAEEKARKVNAVRAVRRGQAYATNNLNNAMWSTVNILAWLLPSGTSPEEVVAILSPSLTTMYGAGNGPITLASALGKAQEMAERALEKRAHDEAADEAVRKLFASAPQRMDASLASVALKDLDTLDALAKAEAELAHVDIVFHVPSEKFYYRGGDGSFDLQSPVGKDGIMAHLTHLGVHGAMVKELMKDRTFVKVHAIDFAPRQTTLYKKAGLTVINSWRPPDIVPAQGTYPSIDRVLNSLLFNDTGTHTGVDNEGKAWLVNWLAWCVQNPNGVPGVAVLFNGRATGTGKNTLAHVMMRIFGEDNCAKITSRQIEGRFTSQWISKCFIFGDEIYSSESREHVTDVLKDLITGQVVISESKGINERAVQNRAKFMFASNNELPVKLDATDRRFAVFTRNTPITEEYRAFTQSLFTPENKSTPEFDAEIAAFAWDLERMVVDTALVKVPHANHSRMNLMEAASSSDVAFCKYVDEYGVDGLLKEAVASEGRFLLGDWKLQAEEMFGVDWDFGDRGIRVQALHAAYRAYCKKTGVQRPRGLSQFGVLIQGHQPAWQRRHLWSPKMEKQVKTYQVKRTVGSAGAVVPEANRKVEAQA